MGYKDEADKDPEEFMKRVRELFVLSVERHKENRTRAKEDIEFSLLGEQWDAADVEKRRKKGKPCITVNKLPPFIHQVVNDGRQNRPAIRVRPVDDNADPQTAEILNGLIRNIEVASNADVVYDTALMQSVSGGFGYARVNIKYVDEQTFDREIIIERIPNQFSVFEDAHAMSVDGSDWKYCFVTDRIPKEEFEERFGEDADTTDFPTEQDYDWINDDGIWIAEFWEIKEEDGEKICLLSSGDVVTESDYKELKEYYDAAQIEKVDSRTTKTRKICQYLVNGKEVLEKNEWAGDHIPIIPVYGEEVIVENKRYFKSLIRDAKGPQQLLNFWKTTTTELVALAPKTPFIGPENAFAVDESKWATANTEDHAFIRYKGAVPPQRQPYASVPAGALQETMSADADIKATVGMFGASIGEEDNAISGKAIGARQRESDTGSFHFIDNLSRSLRQIGVIIVDLVPKVYTPGRIVRIVGEDRKETTNVQIGQKDQQKDQQEQQADPMQEGMRQIFDPSIGKYDVVVDIGPGYTTKRQEAAGQMIEFSRVNPGAAQLISDLIAKNLDWPGADEIAERFRAVLPPAVTGQNPELQQMQQQMQQMQQQSQQAIAQLQQELQQTKASKEIDLAKVKIDAYGAETDRLKTVQTGMTPEQIQMMIMQTIQQLMQTPDITPMQGQMIQPEMAQPGVQQ